tara:strand:+ start:625 stop:837 length:213 start_codon:yes stop_codon:yes gene_type:complete
MTRHKIVNGEKINLTAEEETARDTEEAQAATDKQAVINAETAKETKKASGKQKLKDLGLDDDEIKALIGV